MPYIHFTEKQKLRANSVDLVELLRRQGETLIRSGPEYRMASDHSVTVRGSEWYDHAVGRGGGPISFMQKFYGLTYPEAVARLLDGEQGQTYEPTQKETEKPAKAFVLPPASANMKRTYAYLLHQRKISREVLDHFVRSKLIYESAEPSKNGEKEYHNIVFVGLDKGGIARHAHKHGLYTMGPSYKRNVAGCDPHYSFHYTGSSDRLYVFEAPIDMLSFLSLHARNWQEHSYVALCGISGQAMFWMLETYPKLQQVALCLDHDEAGIEAAGRLTDELKANGYTQVRPLFSVHKDWNEDLKAAHGMSAQPAEEHPLMTAAGPVCERIAALAVVSKGEWAQRQLSGALQRCEQDLRWGRMEQVAGHMESIASLALACARRELRQLGEDVSKERLSALLQEHMQPHRNRADIKTQVNEISGELQAVLEKAVTVGVRTRAEKESIAGAWLELAVSCAKVPVQYEADRLRQEQKQNETFSQEMG